MNLLYLRASSLHPLFPVKRMYYFLFSSISQVRRLQGVTFISAMILHIGCVLSHIAFHMYLRSQNIVVMCSAIVIFCMNVFVVMKCCIYLKCCKCMIWYCHPNPCTCSSNLFCSNISLPLLYENINLPVKLSEWSDVIIPMYIIASLHE